MHVDHWSFISMKLTLYTAAMHVDYLSVVSMRLT